MGHALGFSAWAVGAGIRNDPLQSVGAGVVAGSEVFRIIFPALNAYSERLSHVVTERNEQGGPLLPVRNPRSEVGALSQAGSMNNPVASSAAAFAPPTLPSIESGPSFSSMIPESMTGSASRSVLPLSGSTVAALGPVNSPSRNSSAASPTVAYEPAPINATRAHTR
ncbi:hypothetical protein STPH1_7250 [Streptomyces sp. OM5714]|nr:hypothetical protein STPH1_7250 [Streptomyces sp. OM5714]